jgi:hypothetical protein
LPPPPPSLGGGATLAFLFALRTVVFSPNLEWANLNKYIWKLKYVKVKTISHQTTFKRVAGRTTFYNMY